MPASVAFAAKLSTGAALSTWNALDTALPAFPALSFARIQILYFPSLRLFAAAALPFPSLSVHGAVFQSSSEALFVVFAMLVQVVPEGTEVISVIPLLP